MVVYCGSEMKGSCAPLLLILLVLSELEPVFSTQVRGTLDYHRGDDFVKFLTKFGVEKGHDVFVFGKADRKYGKVISFNSGMLLAFIPATVWKGFYKASKGHSSDHCERVINGSLHDSRYTDSQCPEGKEDYLRFLPCKDLEGSIVCDNQPPPEAVPLVHGSQFTYRVHSVPRTEFYYAFLIGCYRNYTATMSCEWNYPEDVEFTFTVHIVNSDPDKTNHTNPFVYEFPYQLNGILILFLTFTSCYLSLFVFHLVIHTRLCNTKDYRMHRLIQVFTVSLTLELVHVVFEMIHYSVYAHNGMGVIALKYLGEVFNLFSDWLLILVLILMGKGWQLTTAAIRWKKVTFTIWGMYIFFSALYFMWLVVQEQVYPYMTEDDHPYQTWAGGLYLGYRLIIFIYVLYELRQIYLVENMRPKRVLYGFLVVFYVIWFCYLPLVVIITIFLNPVQKTKVVSTVYLTIDLLANAVMVLLFCPLWSDLYFQFKSHVNDLTKYNFQVRYRSLKEYGSSGSFISTSGVI